MNESDFIAALRQLRISPAARGLEDDCAVLPFGNETLVLTHDMMAEGTHYPPGADMADVAWKLVAVNLSDLAAKGAEPVGLLLGHMLGPNDERFLQGLRDVLAAYGVPLLGGDTISAAPGPRALGLTAIGRATHVPVPDRRGAKPGDTVWVTGAPGRAMLGFEGDANHAESYNRPRPLLDEGRALAPHVSAMMDISDGLLLDAWRLAHASGVVIRLKRENIPVADPARLDECVRWGDDYELLFTLPPGCECPIEATRIGCVEQQDGAALWLGDESFETTEGLGYQHRSP